MSLAALEAAVLQHVVDTLTDTCGRPPPERAFRYHGPTAGIDCCTTDPDAEGYLVISWSREPPSGPGGAQSRGSVCLLEPVLEVRYNVCWKLPEVNDSGGPIITDDLIETWDADAATLADVADCVSRALCALNCTGRADAPDVLQQVHCDSFTFLEAVPIAHGSPAGGGGGGCVGILWRAKARLKPSTQGT